MQFSPSPPFIFAGADKGRGEARQGKEGERRPPAMDPLIKLLDDDVVRDPHPTPTLLILEIVCFFGGKGRKDSNGGSLLLWGCAGRDHALGRRRRGLHGGAQPRGGGQRRREHQRRGLLLPAAGSRRR